MPMRRTIGFFLAVLVIPVTASAKMPGRSGLMGSGEIADTAEGTTDPNWSVAQTTGRSQYGKAAWYDLVGSFTSSGEILDTVTATAAHRTLPLHSYAKVTNLDSGRSLIVKINDRGPYTQGRIIDLSPRAAEQLEMKQAGVVPVIVEPVASEPNPQQPALNNRVVVRPAATATPRLRETRAEVGATAAAPAPAWVDPRLEQAAPSNQAAATVAVAAPREARAEIRAAAAAPAPAWVDPRLEQSAPSNQAAAIAVAPEIREARAEIRAAAAAPAPAWIDPRFEQPAPSNQAAATAAAPESREARAELRGAMAAPAPAWVDPRLEQR